MNVLRSINIQEDFAHPERASHFRPTRKSMDILRAVIGQNGSNATSVIATYGSGKSIAALVGAVLAEGRSDKIEALGDVREKVIDFEPDLEGIVPIRARASKKAAARNSGFVVLLNGFVPNLAREISRQLGISGNRPLPATLAKAEELCRSAGGGKGRLAIIWDEFGRHLEALVADGRADELARVQDLAEWTVRRPSMTATLTLLLHQDFRQYAGRLGRTEQVEWQKVEGRFETLRIIEEGDDIYRFIADVVTDLFPGRKASPMAANARKARDLNLFPFLGSDGAVRDLLRRSAPLSPAVLYLLPKIAGRIGQSERTLFGFLGRNLEMKAGTAVCIEDLYGYFSDAMRLDTGAGGVFQRYVQTESARTRAKTDLEREALAGTALLHMATSVQDGRVSRDRLLKFLEIGLNCEPRKIERAVNALCDRKLLLHKKFVDEVSVWHGTDVNVEALCDELAEGLREDSTAIEHVRAQVPAPVYYAPEYNFERRMTRFAVGHFVEMATLLSEKGRDELGDMAEGCDALVCLVVDGTSRDFPKVPPEWQEAHPNLILAFSRNRPQLVNAALKCAALEKLSKDQDLLDMDPLVSQEIEELRANALEYLESRASSLVEAGVGEVAWHREGRCLGSGESLKYADELATLFRLRFEYSPRIANEQVVRRNVTSQTRSARKRLLLGILERSHLPDLGFGETSTSTSAASLYRTVLADTGLHCRKRGRWAKPGELGDEGLNKVWNELRDFFATPREEPKSFETLIDGLTGQVYGVRKGVIPILVGSGLKAFGDALAIRRDSGGAWSYVDDIQPSTVEDMCESPDRFEIEVLDIDEDVRDRVRRLTSEFGAETDAVEGDVIRAFHDAFSAWRLNLGSAAAMARVRSGETKALFDAIRRTRADPVHLLFGGFPKMAGEGGLTEAVLKAVSRARVAAENVATDFVESSIAAAGVAFAASREGCEDDSDEKGTLLEAARNWASQIPDSALGARVDSVARGIVRRARRLDAERDSEASFARSLSLILVSKDFDEWDESTVGEFARRLRGQILSVEDSVVNDPDASEDVAPLLRRRIAADIAKLERVIGRDAAAPLVERMGSGPAGKRTGVRHGTRKAKGGGR